MKKLLLALSLIIFSTVVKAQFAKLGFATNVGTGLNENNNLNKHLDISIRYLRFNTTPTSTVNIRAVWIF